MSAEECQRCGRGDAFCEGQRPVGPCNLFVPRPTGRPCAVCAERDVEPDKTVCAACRQSYDGPDLKGPSTPDIIRWAAARARDHERRRGAARAALTAAQAHERRIVEARRILAWMEHENLLAHRETHCGDGWLSDHTAAMADMDRQVRALLEEEP